MEEELNSVADWVSTEWGSLTTTVGDDAKQLFAWVAGVPSWIETILVLLIVLAVLVLAIEFFAPRLLGV